MKKILVITEDAPILAIIVAMLTDEGYAVFGEDNGEAGIDRAMMDRPDLVICDLAMRGLRGFGMLFALRLRRIADVPFIFLSANKYERHPAVAGMSGRLNKPFAKSELLSTVRVCLRRRSNGYARTA